MDENLQPQGELTIRTLAMPADTNPAGDIFGGWVMSQMDIAGSLAAKKITQGRTVTVAVDSMSFHKPVFVGDTLCCYTKILSTGRTSIKVHIEAWASRQYEKGRTKVTEGTFTFVSVTDDRKPKPIEEHANHTE